MTEAKISYDGSVQLISYSLVLKFDIRNNLTRTCVKIVNIIYIYIYIYTKRLCIYMYIYIYIYIFTNVWYEK